LLSLAKIPPPSTPSAPITKSVNTTEEILVSEIAEHYWRIRRYRTII
jgi:hypothetical protein